MKALVKKISRYEETSLFILLAGIVLILVALQSGRLTLLILSSVVCYLGGFLGYVGQKQDDLHQSERDNLEKNAAAGILSGTVMLAIILLSLFDS